MGCAYGACRTPQPVLIVMLYRDVKHRTYMLIEYETEGTCLSYTCMQYTIRTAAAKQNKANDKTWTNFLEQKCLV